MSTSVLTMPWVPTPSDGLTTETLTSQLEVEQVISSLLTTHMTPGAREAVSLQRSQHVQFVTSTISDKLHPAFTALDASRPWLLYWSVHSLALLGSELDQSAKNRLVKTLEACQNRQGGYGGGPGQLSHLAPSYAAVSALCYIGQEGWDSIDRNGMYRFLLSLKQDDGSFVMHKGGEVDVRGCYCALVIASLLNILTPELARGTSSFIASCQTYEGGLASSSHPGLSPAPPLGESHGGYAFCAVASYVMLRPLTDPTSPASVANEQAGKLLDVQALLRWAASMQAMPIEGGGFRGRSNKLVDGCYSLWGGGLFPLIGGLLAEKEQEQDAFVDLLDRKALQEYILFCAQAPGGGLRDKPGKHPDGYHTCYNLSGLASAQHKHTLPSSTVEHCRAKFVSPFEGTRIVDVEEKQIDIIMDPEESEESAEKRMREVWARAMGWIESDKLVVGDQSNEVVPCHPVFNLCEPNCRAMMNHFYKQEP